jgi:5-methylcytosine-specific restriction protein A
MSSKDVRSSCELCLRLARLTEHHLVPRSEARRGLCADRITQICRVCHRTIHAIYSNRELALHWNTIARLNAAPGLRRYLAWIRRAARTGAPPPRAA